MAMDTLLRGVSSGTGVEVAGTNQLKVIPETDATANPGNVGGIRHFGENDGGLLTGSVLLRSPEVDVDYRERAAQDLIYDDHVFNTTAQDSGKHSYAITTMTNGWTAGQMTTNSGSITTVNTGTVFATYAFFPLMGTTTLAADTELGFSAQPQTNTFVEFGIGIPGTATTAPPDGVFFRLNSAGLQGIASFNGTETSTGVFPATGGTGTWTYTNAKRYQFICYATAVEAVFWVNDGTGAKCMGVIPLPTAQSRMCMSSAGQFFLKHRITGGTAGGVLQATIGAYNVRVGGPQVSTTASTQGNRVHGSYQTLSGTGAYGTSARFGTITTGNEANVTAAVPTTTTAALGSGLGGKFWETVSLAANTDGIIMSYQVPAGTVNYPGRRLVLRGIYLNSYVQTVIAGGPYTAEWFLAFGHTSVSLATTEAGSVKAPRRIVLPFVQQVTAAQAVQTTVAQNTTFCNFGDAPVYVNPGEFIQLCTRHIGAAGTSGTIVHQVTPVYGWE